MKDLIERLKDAANGFFGRDHPLGDYGICDEAAAALSSQAARIEELEALLRIEREDRKNNAPF